MINEKKAKKYCSDDISKIENYDKAISDNTQTWHCHHRRESILTSKELVEIGEYYNRPSIELIFLPPSQHSSLFHIGKILSEETKQRISDSHKGELNPFFGRTHSKETRSKMSLSRTGKCRKAETKEKIRQSLLGKNDWVKGRHWFNNGKISVMAKECPEGFTPGRLLTNTVIE